MSPFSYDSTGGNRVFTGEQNTDAWVGAMDLDDLDDCNPDPPRPSEVCITRADYNVSVYAGSYDPGSEPPVQNLSFSAYGFIDRDQRPQAAYRQTKDDVYIQSLPSGEILSFKARSGGETAGQRDSQLLWRCTFNAPIVTIFDVLTSQESRDDILVLLQPRPHLQGVLPDLTDTRLSDRKSAFVGMVKETGSLFVMSPARFPHVLIGGPETGSDASTATNVDD